MVPRAARSHRLADSAAISVPHIEPVITVDGQWVTDFVSENVRVDDRFVSGPRLKPEYELRPQSMPRELPTEQSAYRLTTLGVAFIDACRRD